MRRIKLLGLGLLGLVVAGAGAEHLWYTSNASTMMSHAAPGKIAMAPAPIRKEWVLEGQPKTEAGEIAHSSDGFNQVYLWQTTKSRFNWNYDFDETITIVDGDVFITDESGQERHLVAGDVAFFPVGARTTWRVPDHLRKVAVIKKPVPGAVASSVRWVHTLKSWAKPSTAFAAQ